MNLPDAFSQSYGEFLEDTYDCVDRIVLNGYFYMGQSGGGFRVWWNRLHGTEDNLDNAHLMRYASRFSRRVHAWAKAKKVPLVYCPPKTDKSELMSPYLPSDPDFQGVFCILVGRAPASVHEVGRGRNGVTHLSKKLPFVNQYFFHIMDPDWGHLMIQLCPYPPFNALITLNGHEYTARQAQRQGLLFTKEDNCFTQISNATDLGRVAQTMTQAGVGRLVEVCERWIYSACLSFALNQEEQRRSGFHYGYSVYQTEYSRNLLFLRGRVLEQIFQSVIDRTRVHLNLKRIKTIFGRKQRPHHRKGPRLEIVIERPTYDLIVLKIHFGKLTIRIYSKGERVLRIEVIVHNTQELGCGKRVDRFPEIVARLKDILERFLEVLHGVDRCFVNQGMLESWSQPSQPNSRRVAGLDINSPRIRAVMQAVIARAAQPGGFTASQLATEVNQILGTTSYQPRQAAYDLKKLRAKNLVSKTDGSRRYGVPLEGLRSLVGFLTLRDKILEPLLAGSLRPRASKTQNRSAIDIHYATLQTEMHKLFQTLGIAA